MDEFKKYLQENKTEMDFDTPSSQLLQRIQTQTAPKKKGKLYTLLIRVTAAACILILITIGIKWLLDKKQIKVETAGIPPAPKTPDIVQTSNDTRAQKDTTPANAGTNIAAVDP